MPPRARNWRILKRAAKISPGAQRGACEDVSVQERVSIPELERNPPRAASQDNRLSASRRMSSSGHALARNESQLSGSCSRAASNNDLTFSHLSGGILMVVCEISEEPRSSHIPVAPDRAR